MIERTSPSPADRSPDTRPVVERWRILTRGLRWLGMGMGRRQRQLEASLWRALIVYRFITLPQVAWNGWVLFRSSRFDVAAGCWAAAGVLLVVAWSVVAAVLTNRTGYRRWIASGDLVIAVVGGLISVPAAGWSTSYPHDQPLVGLWAGAPGIAWALADGPLAGVAAVLVNLLPSFVIHEGILGPGTYAQTLLYALATVVIGYTAFYVRRAERAFAEGVRLQAATAERERLAREIHDGVLQVLALVSRNGPELGAEGAQLARLAAEQEAALRSLIQSRPGESLDGDVDLKELLTERAQVGRFQLSAPAGQVALPSVVAVEIAAAVGAALDNVRKHVGPEANAWILLEDEDGAITVTVRDEGPGIPAGRLAEAESEGRLGMAQSVRGRIRDVGGTVEIVSTPGEGTEVEMRVPYRS